MRAEERRRDKERQGETRRQSVRETRSQGDQDKIGEDRRRE